MFGAVQLLFLLFALLLSAEARAESQAGRTHVVHSGQRLGSIAKRYNVTVDAIANANGIKPTDTIRPGQRLLIPSRDQKPPKGSLPARVRSSSNSSPKKSAERRAVTHRVASGQRLETIAKKYGVTVDAICGANRIQPRSIIRPGQALLIPGVATNEAPEEALGGSRSTYHAYLRAPRAKGRVEFIGHTQRFKGHVFDKKGRVLPAAMAGISRVLGATGKRPDPDKRLIRLLVDVSDKFGGRPLRIVSGYRTSSFFEDSRHKESRAVDFSVPGVPNEALKDYLRTLRNVGVGYYPNSSFVHADVREYAAYWVDYAGPGEAPRTRSVAYRVPRHTNGEGATAEPRSESSSETTGVVPGRASRLLDELAKLVKESSEPESISPGPSGSLPPSASPLPESP